LMAVYVVCMHRPFQIRRSITGPLPSTTAVCTDSFCSLPSRTTVMDTCVCGWGVEGTHAAHHTRSAVSTGARMAWEGRGSGAGAFVAI
jgi:hypothetical protein